MATAVRAAGSSAGSAAAASSGVMFPSAMACASEIVRKEGEKGRKKELKTQHISGGRPEKIVSARICVMYDFLVLFFSGSAA